MWLKKQVTSLGYHNNTQDEKRTAHSCSKGNLPSQMRNIKFLVTATVHHTTSIMRVHKFLFHPYVSISVKTGQVFK